MTRNTNIAHHENFTLLAGFSSIRAVPCSLLTEHIELMAETGVPVAVYGGFSFEVYDAAMEISRQSDGNPCVESVVMRFKTADSDAVAEIMRSNHSFHISTPAFGNVSLGHREPPFPAVETTQTVKDPTSGASYWDVKISLKREFATYISEFI